MGLLLNSRRTAEVVARSFCTVLIINKAAYSLLLERKVSKDMESRLSFYQRHLFQGE